VPQELEEMRQITDRKKDELSTKWLWGGRLGLWWLPVSHTDPCRTELIFTCYCGISIRIPLDL